MNLKGKITWFLQSANFFMTTIEGDSLWGKTNFILHFSWKKDEKSTPKCKYEILARWRHATSCWRLPHDPVWNTFQLSNFVPCVSSCATTWHPCDTWSYPLFSFGFVFLSIFQFISRMTYPKHISTFSMWKPLVHFVFLFLSAGTCTMTSQNWNDLKISSNSWEQLLWQTNIPPSSWICETTFLYRQKLPSNFTSCPAVTISLVSVWKIIHIWGSFVFGTIKHKKLTLLLYFLTKLPKYIKLTLLLLLLWKKILNCVCLWKNLWYRREQKKGSSFHTSGFMAAECNFQRDLLGTFGVHLIFSFGVLLVPIIGRKPMRKSGKWSRHLKRCGFVVHEFKNKYHKGSKETYHQQDEGSCSIVNSTMVWLQGSFLLLVIFGWEIQVFPLHYQPRLHHSQQSENFGTTSWPCLVIQSKGRDKIPTLTKMFLFVVYCKLTSH